MSLQGNIPPQAIDLEKAVLGSFLIDKKALDEVLIDLHREVFYDPKHQLIFDAIKSVYLEENQVDLLTVTEQLKKNKTLEKSGGSIYLIKLTQAVSSTANIDFHSKIILQKYLQREVIHLGNEMVKNGYNQDADALELIEESYRKLNKISETNVKAEEKKLGDVVDEVIEKGIRLFDGKITPGIITPIDRITKNTGGWADSELIILAGRPGMGKTSFALSCVLEPAKQGISTAFFSLEMSKSQLTTRLLSMEYKIPSDKFRKSGLDASDLQKIDNRLNEIPLYIDDTPSISIEHFQIKANQMKSKYDIQLIVVDYIQLMSAKAKGGTRENEVSKISRGLKLIAKELDIPVIALSQLSRGVEMRGGNKRPQLSDLRESGAIEQDADVVGFLYRPEYYGITEWDDDDRESCLNQAEFIIAKNRNGGLLRTRMSFEGQFTLFSDLEEANNYPEPIGTKEELPKPNTNDAFGVEEVPF